MKRSKKIDESKFDFIEEYAKAVEEADQTAAEETEVSEAGAPATESESAGAAKDEVTETKDSETEVSETEASANEASETATAESEPEAATSETSAQSPANPEDLFARYGSESAAAAPPSEEEDDDDPDSPANRRILRHKRRVRNQLIAYSVLLVLLVIIGVGVAFATHYIMGEVNARREAQAEAEAAEAAAAEAAAEEEIVVEAPDYVAEEEEVPDTDYEEEEEPLSEEDYLNEMVTSTIAQMPIEDKIAQLFVITPEALTGVQAATRAGDGTQEALGKYAVCGLIYDRRNIEDEDQLLELISNTKNMSKYELLLGLREAGGDYSVLSGSALEDIPSVDTPAQIAETGDSSNAYNAGVTMASYLSYFGFNLNLTPNGSLTTDVDSVSVDLSYGSEEAQACDMITQMINGLATGSISSCMTDFPGTGSVTELTADGRVDSEMSAEEISAGLVPYITGIAAGAGLVQVNNVTYINVDSSAMPASLSEYMITDVLRGEMAYDGVVITGPLNEKAVTEYYTPDEAALYALAAGADIIYMPEDFEAAYAGLLDAVAQGNLPESRVDQSLERIFRVKLAGYVE